ncbi:MAG: fibronectin type III domain-containing protein, partial [Mycobacteriales bacterium]
LGRDAMRRSATRVLLAAAVTALMTTAGASAAGAAGPSTQVHHPVSARTGLPLGMTPLHGVRRASAVRNTLSVTPALTYRNGPVVSNAKVASVLWGGASTDYLPEVGGTAAPSMSTFFAGVAGSSYWSWLSEYDTPASPGTHQSIGYGSFQGRTAITPSAGANGSTINDTSIQTELVAQINAGHLPAPVLDAGGHPNTVYALFFPAGKTICMGSDCSGVVFCAYHNTMTATVKGVSRTLLYMVLPDFNNANMINGCGSTSATTAFQVTQSSASHELVETATDPYVGLATGSGAPLGWYDDNNGEIADICASQPGDPNGTVTGSDGVTYTVQKEWSNALSSCIVDKGSTTPAAPQAPAAAAAAGGAVKVSWSKPAADGGTAVAGYDIYQSTTGGSSGAKVGAVGATATSWTSGALTNGGSYFFQVLARNANGDGPLSPQVSAVADSVAPTVSMTSPASLFQLSTLMTARYGGADSASGVASYDVQYRSAAWNGGFGSYANLVLGTTATSRSLSGSPGREYCFHVRSRDHAGNTSAWSADRCAVLPLDDRSLTAATSGWSRLTSSSAHRSTLTRTTTYGARLTLSGAQVDRVALVVTTCSTCGSVAIYVNGGLWHTVSTAASSSHWKVIILPGSFSLRSAAIVLRSVSSGKQLLVDGLAIART